MNCLNSCFVNEVSLIVRIIAQAHAKESGILEVVSTIGVVSSPVRPRRRVGLTLLDRTDGEDLLILNILEAIDRCVA